MVVGAAGFAHAEVATVDSAGRLHALLFQSRYRVIETSLVAHSPQGWNWGTWSERPRSFSREDGVQRAATFVPLNEGEIRYDTTISDAGAGISADIRVTEASDTSLSSVDFMLELPVADFSGGNCVLDGASAPGVGLPAESPENWHLLSAEASELTALDATGQNGFRLKLDHPRRIGLQDGRRWGRNYYQVVITVGGRDLRHGGQAALHYELVPLGHLDSSPAILKIDAEGAQYPFDGFGGNYAFNLDSPVVEFTRRALHPRWARIEMKMTAWEPKGAPAGDRSDAQLLAAADRAGSDLHRSFAIARTLQSGGTALCMSLWDPPPWMFKSRPARPDQGGPISAEEWPQVVAAVTSHLLYAKEQYGIEPSLFSFNEPDEGVRIRMTAEEQRDIARMLGRSFAQAGLKTRFLAGDVAAFRRTADYVKLALADPQARQAIGAVGVHSWGGALSGQMRDWLGAASSHDLPLLVTEAGLDTDWRFVGGWLNSPAYALEEQRLFQQLLAVAHPAALLEWEYTPDYGLGQVSRLDPRQVTPTRRFYFLQPWCDFMPARASAVPSQSSAPDVSATALRGGAEPAEQWTIQVLNVGGQREVTITGLPKQLVRLREFCTAGDSPAAESTPAVSVEDGVCRFVAPEHTLITLTTLVERVVPNALATPTSDRRQARLGPRAPPAPADLPSPNRKKSSAVR